ncbi:hypothetical protein QQP08_025906 [Theobroma cacao]|nr:hypothetical protein QQP08_025906 [Theobroma cacao]
MPKLVIAFILGMNIALLMLNMISSYHVCWNTIYELEGFGPGGTGPVEVIVVGCSQSWIEMYLSISYLSTVH